MKSIRKTPTKARQGERGPSMLLVLSAGIGLVVIAFLVIGWISSDGSMPSLGIL